MKNLSADDFKDYKIRTIIASRTVRGRSKYLEVRFCPIQNEAEYCVWIKASVVISPIQSFQEAIKTFNEL